MSIAEPTPGRRLLDVLGQDQGGAVGEVPDVLVFRGTDRPHRVIAVVEALFKKERTVARTGRTTQVGDDAAALVTGACRASGHLQQGRQDVQMAHRLATPARRHSPSSGRTDDERDLHARVVERALRPGQRRAVVGGEHHGGAVRVAVPVDRVDHMPDGGVELPDRAVERGEVLSRVGVVRQVRRDFDGGGVGVGVVLGRPGAVHLPHPDGEEKRPGPFSTIPQPCLRLPGDGPCPGQESRAVHLVEPEDHGVRMLVLQADQRGVVSETGHQLGHGGDAAPVAPSGVGETHQPVDVGESPVNSDERAGVQSGAVAKALSKTTDRSASACRLGLGIAGAP